MIADVMRMPATLINMNNRVFFKGKFLNQGGFMDEQNKAINRKDYSYPDRKKKIKLAKVECLDCEKKFQPKNKYNKMCDYCKGKYNNVMWER